MATTNNTTVNSGIMSASQKMANRASTFTGRAVTAKECRDKLQNKGIVRTGGNSANGLLAIGGASLVINVALVTGVTVAALLSSVTACPRVSKPVNKIADHLQNSFKYADPSRLAACGITAALRADNLYNTDRSTVPYLTVNDAPVASMTATQLQALPSDAVLRSPLLAAIGAYTSGHTTAPAWVRDYMPASPDLPATTTKSKRGIKSSKSVKAIA